MERKIEIEIPRSLAKQEKFLACISSNHEVAKKVIRKTARLAAYYNSKWYVLYVQTPKEDGDKIGLAAQRHLINNFKLATELGGEVIKIKSNNISNGILEITKQKSITSVCIGKPHWGLFNILLKKVVFNELLKKLSAAEIDLVLLS